MTEKEARVRMLLDEMSVDIHRIEQAGLPETKTTEIRMDEVDQTAEHMMDCVREWCQFTVRDLLKLILPQDRSTVLNIVVCEGSNPEYLSKLNRQPELVVRPWPGLGTHKGPEDYLNEEMLNSRVLGITMSEQGLTAIVGKL